MGHRVVNLTYRLWVYMADFKQSSGLFLKHVSSVLSGTAVAQFIPVIGSLIIARQYLLLNLGYFQVGLEPF